MDKQQYQCGPQPFSNYKQDTKSTFPGGQQRYVQGFGYQSESQFVDGIDGQVFRRAVSLEKF